MNKKWLVGCSIAGLIVLGGGVMSLRSLMKAAPKAELNETVSRGDVEIKVTETGTIEPLHKVEVKSKVGGRLKQLLVDAGDLVKAGQTLAIIDPQEINSQVAAERAQLAGAQARLAAALKTANYQGAQTVTSIEQYRQNLSAASARLRQTEAEAKAQPLLTRQTIEMAQANLDAARASLHAQEETLQMLKETTHPQNIVNARSAFDQARVQADNARRNLKRQQQLLQKGFISQQAIDNAEVDLQVAEAHLSEARTRQEQIQQANAIELENMQSQVLNFRSQVRQLESALAQAKSGVLPFTKSRELESARAAYLQAKAQLNAALSGKTQDLVRKDEASSAAAEVSRIQNELAQMLVQQKDSTLIASMSGLVTRKYAEQGELIASATSAFAQGTAVFQIADLSTMLIKININEVDISKITPGLPTEVTIDASRGITFMGRVRKLAPAALADSSSSGSGQSLVRFPVEIQIDHADARLKPGMSARCSIIVSRRKEALRIPTNCLLEENGKTFVQVVTTSVEKGKPTKITTKREVKTGLRGDDFIEILSGVKEGETIKPNPFSGPPRKTVNVMMDNGGGRNR